MENLTKPLIEIQDLKQHFKIKGGLFGRATQTVKAVDGVSFNIYRGETFGLVGESGSGKTTLGRTLLHLYNPTSGKIFFDGEEINKENYRNYAKKMQIIFQDPYASLNPRMTVEDIIGEALDVHKLYSTKKERRDKIIELLKLVGLNAEQAQRYPHEFSGGQRQRIGIARALAVSPEFIVCDEPVSALDVSIQAQILNLLQDLQEEKGFTYMFITHDLSVVKHISDEIMVMYVGCMVEKCEAKQLFKRPLHPYTKGLLSAIPIPNIHSEKKRIIMQGELTTPIDPKPGCRFANRCQYACEKCFIEQPPYQEVLDNHFVSCHYAKEINNL